MNVQHWLAETSKDTDGVHVPVACPACAEVHFIHARPASCWVNGNAKTSVATRRSRQPRPRAAQLAPPVVLRPRTKFREALRAPRSFVVGRPSPVSRPLAGRCHRPMRGIADTQASLKPTLSVEAMHPRIVAAALQQDVMAIAGPGESQRRANHRLPV